VGTFTVVRLRCRWGSCGVRKLRPHGPPVAEFVLISIRLVHRESPDCVVLGQGRVIDEITEDQRKYYGLDAGDFPNHRPTAASWCCPLRSRSVPEAVADHAHGTAAVTGRVHRV
jgi:hypothetical protein